MLCRDNVELYCPLVAPSLTRHQQAMLVMHFRNPGNEETKCVLERTTSRPRATGKYSAQLSFRPQKRRCRSVGSAESETRTATEAPSREYGDAKVHHCGCRRWEGSHWALSID